MLPRRQFSACRPKPSPLIRSPWASTRVATETAKPASRAARACGRRWAQKYQSSVTRKISFGDLPACGLGNSVIILVPSHEAGNAFIDADPRHKTEVAGAVVDICRRRLDVARLHRLEIEHRIATQRLLDRLDEVHQRLGLIVAQVIDAVRPGRIGGQVYPRQDPRPRHLAIRGKTPQVLAVW